MNRLTAALASCLLLLGACGPDYPHRVPRPHRPRPVSIEIEVYDPVTNALWVGVSVRIVEAWNEWSDCVCESPYYDLYYTDGNGRVYLSEYDLAAADVGFLEDGYGALLDSDWTRDQASVLLELDAPGFPPQVVEVPLSWAAPDAFVSVPFF